MYHFQRINKSTRKTTARIHAVKLNLTKKTQNDATPSDAKNPIIKKLNEALITLKDYKVIFLKHTFTITSYNIRCFP